MFRRLVDWIRQGYPSTAPGHCYLIALCGADTSAR